MTTRTDELKQDIADADNSIKWYDDEIAKVEGYIRACRQAREKHYTARRKAEAELARESAPLVKPRGHCVSINGWDV